MKVQLIDYMGTDSTPVKRARVSYNGDNKEFSKEKDQKLLERLMEEKHLGVLEGNVFTFMIECTIPIARQIHRYRTFSYNELSRRYLDDNHTPFEFEIPDFRGDKDKELNLSIEETVQIGDKYFELYEKSLEIYKDLQNLGVAKEIARYVIPQGAKTRFYMTGNLRNFLHFITQRTDSHAQKEIRDVALEIKRLISEKNPKIIEAYYKFN